MTPSLSARSALALLGAAIILPSTGAVPAKLSAEERARLAEETVSAAPKAVQAAQGTGDLLAGATESAKAADEEVLAFLQKAALTTITLETTPQPLPTTKPDTAAPSYNTSTKPLEVKQGPDDTLIEAAGGMYFDADKGLFVYLKDVRLADPRFTLSGANELKVFLEKKEKKPDAKPGDAKPGDEKPGDDKAPAPKPDDTKPDGSQKAADPAAKKAKAAPGLTGATDGFGDVDHITATGAVKVLQKSVDGKPPVEASAAVLNYNAKTGEIILNGGYPWVKQGDKFMRAMEPNLYLRIQKDGSFVTEGNWQMGGQLQNKDDANKNKPNNKPGQQPQGPKPAQPPAPKPANR
ncbi:hypothetical protein KBB96_18065 [Luteolibacter ambystomatis]|uniref:Organic solvent tolerance-like N-terminal domain-containing protein n=1 Tax=Luteolibacter ambystomatis TaxID=2824561 RepID=A0A975G7Z1_9BACT|nr:hypothetical protein [Luteolibacter ambystomatis]QUE50754.1 hypothetical protein KBB96_18065 [Luteolibacter ambystomatis]